MHDVCTGDQSEILLYTNTDKKVASQSSLNKVCEIMKRV